MLCEIQQLVIFTESSPLTSGNLNIYGIVLQVTNCTCRLIKVLNCQSNLAVLVGARKKVFSCSYNICTMLIFHANEEK